MARGIPGYSSSYDTGSNIHVTAMNRLREINTLLKTDLRREISEHNSNIKGDINSAQSTLSEMTQTFPQDWIGSTKNSAQNAMDSIRNNSGTVDNERIAQVDSISGQRSEIANRINSL